VVWAHSMLQPDLIQPDLFSLGIDSGKFFKSSSSRVRPPSAGALTSFTIVHPLPFTMPIVGLHPWQLRRHTFVAHPWQLPKRHLPPSS
jgi:hypothetical protein